MAFLGSLFEKKNCAICGKELGMLGKTKISDGHICKDCSGKLSPYFNGYRSSTAEDIRTQLAYREENARQVASFNPTTTIDGGGKKVYLDENAGRLIITNQSNWRSSNPDLMELSQITGCDTEVRESKTEIKRTNAQGEEVSYNPPRYDIDYDIYVKVFVSSPYFSEISWKVNSSRIDKKTSTEYHEAESKARAVRNALTGIHTQQRAAAAPKRAVTCPNCLATTMPDANGCCEYCGGSLQSVMAHDASPSVSQDFGQQQYDQQQYGQQQYGRTRQQYDQDYDQDYDDRGFGAQQATTRQNRAFGQAKADFRRQNR